MITIKMTVNQNKNQIFHCKKKKKMKELENFYEMNRVQNKMHRYFDFRFNHLHSFDFIRLRFFQLMLSLVYIQCCLMRKVFDLCYQRTLQNCDEQFQR